MTTQELEVYLDTLNKETDEVNGQFVTLTHVNVPTAQISTGAQMSTGEHNSKYFIDQDGNYYCQDNEAVGSKTVLRSATSAKQLPAGVLKNQTVSALPKQEESEDMDFVYIMENVKMDKNTFKDNSEDDPDDPVFEFTANEAAAEEGKDASSKEITPSKLESNGGYVVKCVHCNYTTHKRFLLARHMKAHSDDRPHKCSVCERGFKTNVSLLNHVNTHLGNKPHSCKSCDMCFTTSGELVRHVRYRHTGEKPHKCTECVYASVELSKLRRHIRCHTGERPYQCPHCTYASPDTFKLKRHMRTHTGEKPYECDICHARFTQSNSLKAHRLIHSVGDKPVFQCTLCPTTCGRKTDLRLHMQNLHHSDKPIPCKRCGQELPDRYSYKNHIKTHDGEKCYRCKICPYASISIRHLESHMLIHTDQKPFTCEQCPKAFRQQQLLNRHTNIYHSTDYVPPKPRDKNHTCPHCQRAFTHKGGLMRHMETHDPMSNRNREKKRLKLGRMTRVQADGTIKTIGGASENEDEDTEPDAYTEDDPNQYRYEVVADDDDDEIEDNIMVRNECDYDTEQIKDGDAIVADEDEFIAITAENISKNPNKNVSKKCMSLQVEDGQQYMLVEVIRCDDDDDEDDDENCVTIESTQINNEYEIDKPVGTSNDPKTKDDNFFAFEDDCESSDSKETIHILDMLDS